MTAPSLSLTASHVRQMIETKTEGIVVVVIIIIIIIICCYYYYQYILFCELFRAFLGVVGFLDKVAVGKFQYVFDLVHVNIFGNVPCFKF